MSKHKSRPYLVTNGRRFRLKQFDPDDTGGFENREEAEVLLRDDIEQMRELHEKLYAQDRWSVLVIFQAMDAAGKDSTIKHVMSGLNPQGVEVHSFKSPSTEELDHDYLWRSVRRLPERGRIGVFNRSYYEETLIVRVHEEVLAAQRLPPTLVTKDVWQQRYEDIAGLERYLARNGYLILKFFLNISKEEQKRRFLKRLDEPEKNWKFSASDVRERAHWNEYMRAYQETIEATARPHAPWYVVPADHKWYARLVVADAIVRALEGLNPSFPKLDRRRRLELVEARQVLMREGN
jgi:PPK2 family polyphosphate:nucleotide phosphotransferase